MNMIKKCICLFISITMLLLAGCTKVAQTVSENSKTTSVATTPTPEELKPVNLRWLLPQIQSQNENAAVFEAANKIANEKIKATIKFEAIPWAEYGKKINLMVATNEEVDLFYTANWGGSNYYQHVTNGALVDLTDMLGKVTPNLKAKFSDGVWNATKVNGKIYGVPNQQIYIRKFGLFFRQDLVEKYKFDYASVKKLEDIEPYLKTLKENEPNFIGIENTKGSAGTQLFEAAQNYFGWDTMISMKIPGVGYNTGELKIVNQFETQEFKDFLKLARSWYVKGYSAKDSNNANANAAYRTEGKNAIVSDAVMAPGGVQEFSLSQAKGTTYVENRTMNGDSVLQTGGIVAALNSISITSKNPERALMALDLINSNKDFFNILSWGIEGTNYTKTTDGHIEQVLDKKYEGVYGFFLGDTFQSLVPKGTDLTVAAQTKKINETAKPSVFIGFSPSVDPIKDQIAQCTAVADEMLAGLCTGYLDPDVSYPVFIEKLKKAGSDTIIIELQKQLDAWAKTK